MSRQELLQLLMNMGLSFKEESLKISRRWMQRYLDEMERLTKVISDMDEICGHHNWSINLAITIY